MGDVEVFGRYRLLELLRWAGSETVYRAQDTMMTREVAIKVFPPGSAADAEHQQRYRHEVSVAARLNNPNIIPIYEAGEIDGQLYLVMPALDGIDANTLLQRDGAMSPALAVRVIEQAAAALDSAHSSGLVHGDVKPANLFVVGSEFVYLIDFGAASSTASAHGDIYALAGVLYECLTGRAPESSGSPAPSGIDPAIPPGFDDVIARGMATEPAERYSTAGELACAAKEALSGGAKTLTSGELEFGRYRLLEVLGAGGMGAVYRAHDTELGRDVAVKLLQPGLAMEPGYQERFRREAYAAGRLASPNVVPIYEAGEVDGRLYLVMPIIDGVDVHTVLQRGPMTPLQAVRVVEQVAAALEAAHQAGLVHRDVKPSNLLMVGDDFVYLIDFGLVHEASSARLTQTNVAPGTPAYMAPERFTAGAIADARADVYSLACVLYECLTAQLPFAGNSVEQLVVAHLSNEPPRPSAAAPEIPAGFDRVIARGLAKNPDDRYQSANELAAAARSALTDVSARPATPLTASDVLDPTQDAVLPAAAGPGARRRRGRVIAIAAAVLVVVVVAGAAFFVIDRQFGSVSSTRQVVLPFTGLHGPQGLAVDANGNIYVVDTGANRVLELPAGSTTQTVAPFSGLDYPLSIAVDDRGTVVITEPLRNRVSELTAGSTRQTVLPLTDLAQPTGVAVYQRGPDRFVYVTDNGHNRVLALNEGSGEATELPFSGLEKPCAVAVDGVGGAFVIDRENERVLRLPWTATVASVLPYAIGRPDFVAVDGDGNLYVTDSHANRVLELVKATNAAVTLPFSGLHGPQGVAVDAAGNVYVADAGNNRVLKLPPS